MIGTTTSEAVHVSALQAYSTDTAAQLGLVRQQLSKNDPGTPLDRAHLEGIIASDTSQLFVAWQQTGDHHLGDTLATDATTRAIGMIATTLVRGARAGHLQIEDYVVDEGHRGNGVGKQLMAAALEEARRLGTDRVQLQTDPEKNSDAYHQYRKLGFAELSGRLTLRLET